MVEGVKIDLSRRLGEITAILQNVAMGDYSQTVSIPAEEDELTEHLVPINLMIEDLAEAKKASQEKIDELDKSQTAMLYTVEDLNRQTKEIKEANSYGISRKAATNPGGRLAASAGVYG